MDAVYIHIPFCERICIYCDFPKRVSKNKEINEYLDALYKEVKMYKFNSKVNTIYIGGGTPSILSLQQLDKLNKIISLISLDKNYEFTIESNPEQLSLDKVSFYKKMGVNRISLGVQTFNKKILRLLNRNHSKEDVVKAIDILKKKDLTNINIDLMFALPYQTLEDISSDIKHFEKLDIPHLSYYSLILEEKTVLNKLVNEGKIVLIENNLEAKMYKYIINKIKKLSYDHYEISNFAKKGYKSQHNLKYWNNLEYLGFGMGASGYHNKKRYYNVSFVNEYIKLVNENKKPIKHEDFINKVEKLKEALLLGLRLIEGLDIKKINQRYDVDIEKEFYNELTYLQNKGWIDINTKIKLTKNGLFYGNEVFQMFI